MCITGRKPVEDRQYTPSGLALTEPAFWRRPLQQRAVDFAAIHDWDPLPLLTLDNELGGDPAEFYAVTRFADVLEISRRAQQFTSGHGATAIIDIPTQAAEFFGSFINMDDPRHARQRGIVARAFTPRRLQQVVESVEAICSQLIDDLCEKEEVDLVEAFAAPFPLLVICDMMGIPRSEFDTVLDATNVILSAGDPEYIGDRDPLSAGLDSAMTLVALMTELAETRRQQPTDDLTSALVHADLGDDMLTPAELGSFFILLAVAGNDTTRTATSHGMVLLSEHPEQRHRWQADLEAMTSSAVEEIVRCASPVTYMRRTVAEPVSLSGRDLEPGDRMVLFYAVANRDPAAFPDPDRFDVGRDPNFHVGFGGPGPHYCLGAHLARRELAVAFRHLLTRLPDIDLAGDPQPLEPRGIPLVAGIKRLPVKFTAQARADD
jgi:cytochrome P450